METEEEIQELKENLERIEVKPWVWWKRIGLLILILLLIWGGYVLNG